MPRGSGRLGVAVGLGLLAAVGAQGESASGVPTCAVQDQGYKDPNVPLLNGGYGLQDALTCQKSCQGLVGCQAFTFYTNSGGCWLQGINGSLPAREPIAGVWSGPPECAEQAVAADLAASPSHEPEVQKVIVPADTPQAKPQEASNYTSTDIDAVLTDGGGVPVVLPQSSHIIAAASPRESHFFADGVAGWALAAVGVAGALAACACMASCCFKARGQSEKRSITRGVGLDDTTPSSSDHESDSSGVQVSLLEDGLSPVSRSPDKDSSQMEHGTIGVDSGSMIKGREPMLQMQLSPAPVPLVGAVLPPTAAAWHLAPQHPLVSPPQLSRAGQLPVFPAAHAAPAVSVGVFAAPAFASQSHLPMPVPSEQFAVPVATRSRGVVMEPIAARPVRYPGYGY